MRKVIGVYTSLGASTVFIFEPSKVLHFPRVHLHHHRLPGFSTRLHCGLHFCHKPGTVRGTPNQWRAVGMITWWLPPNSTNNLLGIIYLLILHTSSYKACLFATNQEDDWIRINHIAATFLIISFHFPSHFPSFPSFSPQFVAMVRHILGHRTWQSPLRHLGFSRFLQGDPRI